MSFVLFGVELVALALGLVKLFADLGLAERWADELRAVLLTGCAALVGLQEMGVIFPPESEQWVKFVLGLVAVYLAARGYLPEIRAFIRVVTDPVRFYAYKRAVALWIQAETVVSGDIKGHKAREASVRLARRYRVPEC